MEITTLIETNVEKFTLTIKKSVKNPALLIFIMAKKNDKWIIKNLNLHIASEKLTYDTNVYNLGVHSSSLIGLQPHELQEILNDYWPKKYGKAPIIPTGC
ncbi:hypothetical protein KAJ89_05780 [Candidatus Parcubacteria bacterium]|nr:hypothetical protein [Candidatus Parcubacteria bacterium]